MLCGPLLVSGSSAWVRVPYSTEASRVGTSSYNGIWLSCGFSLRILKRKFRLRLKRIPGPQKIEVEVGRMVCPKYGCHLHFGTEDLHTTPGFPQLQVGEFELVHWYRKCWSGISVTTT